VTTKHFDYIVDRISSARATADGLARGLKHRGLEGQIREIAARECVEPFLTQSYRCGTGKVIDSNQGISDQIDLVVYDRKVVPPILITPDLGLFPIECVRYVFEVKSRLTAAEIRDADKKFDSVARLIAFPKKNADGSITGSASVSTVLLAFDSDISGNELDRYLKHADPTRSTPACVALCVLGKGYWFFDGATKRWHGGATRTGDAAFTEFAYFITGFMNTLAQQELTFRAFQPGSYVHVEDVMMLPRT